MPQWRRKAGLVPCCQGKALFPSNARGQAYPEPPGEGVKQIAVEPFPRCRRVGPASSKPSQRVISAGSSRLGRLRQD